MTIGFGSDMRFGARQGVATKAATFGKLGPGARKNITHVSRRRHGAASARHCEAQRRHGGSVRGPSSTWPVSTAGSDRRRNRPQGPMILGIGKQSRKMQSVQTMGTLAVLHFPSFRS